MKKIMSLIALCAFIGSINAAQLMIHNQTGEDLEVFVMGKAPGTTRDHIKFGINPTPTKTINVAAGDVEIQDFADKDTMVNSITVWGKTYKLYDMKGNLVIELSKSKYLKRNKVIVNDKTIK